MTGTEAALGREATTQHGTGTAGRYAETTRYAYGVWSVGWSSQASMSTTCSSWQITLTVE